MVTQRLPAKYTHRASGSFFRHSSQPPVEPKDEPPAGTCPGKAFAVRFANMAGAVGLAYSLRAVRFANMVGAVGLEPTRPRSADFKSAAYANSATLP